MTIFARAKVSSHFSAVGIPFTEFPPMFGTGVVAAIFVDMNQSREALNVFHVAVGRCDSVVCGASGSRIVDVVVVFDC